jgi:hypothetical protein
MGKKKSSAAKSSDSSSGVTDSGGKSRADDKQTSEFWSELQRTPNMMGDMLYIKAADLRNEVCKAGNEDEIDLMKLAFINLQTVAGKVGWINGMLPEGTIPQVDPQEIRELAKYAALPASSMEDEDGMPIKKSRAEMEEEQRKKDANLYNLQPVPATASPQRANEDIMFLSMFPHEGNLIVSNKDDPFFGSGDLRTDNSNSISSSSPNNDVTAPPIVPKDVNLAILQNGVFSVLRNPMLDQLVLSVQDPTAEPARVQFASSRLSLKFTNMLTFPKPVKHFRLLLEPAITMGQLRELVRTVSGAKPEELQLYMKGKSVPDDVSDDALLGSMGLKNDSKIIISKKPVTGEVAARTGKRISNDNRQFVGDLLFSMGATSNSKDEVGRLAGAMVDSLRVRHGYQVLGKFLRRIVLCRFRDLFLKDRAAKKAANDLLALLDEEDVKEVSSKKKKKEKKAAAAAEVVSSSESAANGAGRVSNTAGATAAATAVDKGRNNNEDEDDEEDEEEDPFHAKALAKIEEEKDRERQKEEEERRHSDAKKNAAARKAKAQAERVSAEAARAHSLYMERLAAETEQKRRKQEEVRAKAQSARLAKEEEEKRLAAKAKKKEKDQLSRKEKNALRKANALEAHEKAMAAMKVTGNGTGSPSSSWDDSLQQQQQQQQQGRSRGPDVNSLSMPQSAFLGGGSVAGAHDILSTISSFGSPADDSSVAAGLLGPLVGLPGGGGGYDGSSGAGNGRSPPSSPGLGALGAPPGMPAPPVVAPVAAMESNGSGGGSGSKSKFCTNCGTRLSPGHKFCGECGAPTAASAPPSATAAPQHHTHALPPPNHMVTHKLAPGEQQPMFSGWGGDSDRPVGLDNLQGALGALGRIGGGGGDGSAGDMDNGLLNHHRSVSASVSPARPTGPPASPPHSSALGAAGLGGLLGGLGGGSSDNNGSSGGGWGPLL